MWVKLVDPGTLGPTDPALRAFLTMAMVAA